MIKTWKNRAKAEEVKNIIDYNFNVVSKYLSKDVKALSTQERKSLSSGYLSENTIVFDIDEEQWYKYSKGSWEPTSIGASDYKAYTQDISIDNWADNSIEIPFNQHGVRNPTVQMFMGVGNSFTPVLGGVEIDSEYNVSLSTDLPFDGKVVIK